MTILAKKEIPGATYITSSDLFSDERKFIIPELLIVIEN